MTDNLLPVSQADRDAAADLLAGAAPDGLREGQQDTLSLVQAFARHRIAHQPTQDRDAVLRDTADFLCARLRDYENCEEAGREFHGHVSPALARLEAALKDLSPVGKESEGA